MNWNILLCLLKRWIFSYKDGKGSNSLKASLKLSGIVLSQANVTAPLGIGVARIY